MFFVYSLLQQGSPFKVHSRETTHYNIISVLEGQIRSLSALPLNTQCVVEVSYWTMVNTVHAPIDYKSVDDKLTSQCGL